MSFKQSFLLAFKSLMSSKMRSFLTMLGIIIGVGAVIVIVSVVNSMTSEILDTFESYGATNVTVSIRGRGGNRSVSIDDMYTLVDENPEYISAMSPTISVAGATAKNGNTNVNPTSCMGVNESYLNIKNSELMMGRGISYADCEERLKNCVVGTYIANELFGTTDVLGETLKINGTNFTIVGVLDETSEGEEASADDVILIPYTSAQKLAYSFTIGSYTFCATSKDTSDKAQQIIEEYLLGVFSDSDAYMVSNMSSVIETVNELTGTMSLVLACIAGVSLLVGGIGIMNIMLVSVTERTREIGIRKSLGATPWDIMSQFVVEAVTTSCLGGVIGIILGIIASYVAVHFLDLKTSISITAVLLSFTVSAAIGIAFGYFPAKKASRLNPIDALRHD